MAPGRFLPPELVDQIIDHLHDDYRTLRNCSLVTRAWSHAARYHLFNEVKLSGKRAMVLSTALSARTSLSYSIRILNICEIASHIYSLSSPLDKAIPHLAVSLPGLHTLRLNNIDFARLSSASVESLANGFQTTQTIHINSVTFHRFSDFTGFITGHRLQLRELSLRNIWWESEGTTTSLRTHCSTKATDTPPECRLILQDVSKSILLWLSSQTCPLNVVDVDYCATLDPQLTSLNPLITGFGSNLHSLIINLHPVTHHLLTNPGFRYPSLLSRCVAQITTLQFTGIILIPPLSRGYTWIVELLRQASENQVETLSFHILCNQALALEHFPWDGIAASLGNAAYTRLHRVFFYVKGECEQARSKSIFHRHSLSFSKDLRLDFILGV